MFNIFKKKEKLIKCFTCSLDFQESDVFKLVYKAVDGDGFVFLCPFCAKTLEKMKDDITI